MLRYLHPDLVHQIRMKNGIFRQKNCISGCLSFYSYPPKQFNNIGCCCLICLIISYWYSHAKTINARAFTNMLRIIFLWRIQISTITKISPDFHYRLKLLRNVVLSVFPTLLIVYARHHFDNSISILWIEIINQYIFSVSTHCFFNAIKITKLAVYFLLGAFFRF